MKAKLEIECPEELLLGLREEPRHFARVIQEGAAISLFREGKISSGMAATWLNIPRIHFLAMAMQAGCELLSDSPEDLRRETALL